MRKSMTHRRRPTFSELTGRPASSQEVVVSLQAGCSDRFASLPADLRATPGMIHASNAVVCPDSLIEVR